jgi:hypothetical protein
MRFIGENFKRIKKFKVFKFFFSHSLFFCYEVSSGIRSA